MSGLKARGGDILPKSASSRALRSSSLARGSPRIDASIKSLHASALARKRATSALASPARSPGLSARPLPLCSRLPNRAAPREK
eukprot:516157-Pyramimonas_sp.AAC.1